MPTSPEAAEAKLDEVVRLLERHRVLESLAERQQTDKRDLIAQMQRRENLVDLGKHLRGTHSADLALMLSRLASPERLLVFRQLRAREAGLTLVELDPDVREAIIGLLDDRELASAVAGLDADDLAFLSSALPPHVFQRASAALNAADQSWLIDTSAYPEGAVGRLMTHDVVSVQADLAVADAIHGLRDRAAVPAQTDRLFLVDTRHVLTGSVPLVDLVRADPAAPLSSIAIGDVTAFRPQDQASRAAKAFERYDLVSAPVVDDLGKLVGRITIDAVVDYLRAASDQSVLAQAGLRGTEDLFAPVSESVRNRWPWLAVNLCTAFAASRVIGVFEHTIAHIAALATLMPIVASIGGNTGNQTIALVIRALALDQLHGARRRLLRKELLVAAANGVCWGAAVGVLTLTVYGSLPLASVMAAAVFLNLAIAALAGVVVPLALRRAGRDPAQGASVVLTFVTDGMGFLLFLGLADLLLR